MANLGGHCLETVIDAFQSIDHDRPVVFIAYTVKGWGTPLAGHKDNHAGLMTPPQMSAFQLAMGVPKGAEWQLAAGLSLDEVGVRDFIAATPYFGTEAAMPAQAEVQRPDLVPPTDKVISTQAAFGKVLDEVARGGGAFADRVITMSPDVTVSTNLGPWVNRRGLFGREAIADSFRQERIPSTQKWEYSPEGQHIELGIAEMNHFLALGAAGLADEHFGEKLYPVGTLYDPFIARGLDALNYACYQDAAFLLVATPSGISLAPEGGRAPVHRHADDRPVAAGPRRLRAGLRRRADRDDGGRVRSDERSRRGRTRHLPAPVDAPAGAAHPADDRDARGGHPRRRLLAARTGAQRGDRGLRTGCRHAGGHPVCGA